MLFGSKHVLLFINWFFSQQTLSEILKANFFLNDIIFYTFSFLASFPFSDIL